MNNIRRCKGYTLLELLIAIFVLSILLAFSFRAVGVLSSGSEKIVDEQLHLENIQKSLTFLERDIRSLSVMPKRSFDQEAGDSGNYGENLLLELSAVLMSEGDSKDKLNDTSTRYLFDKEGLYRDGTDARGVSAKVLLIDQIESASIDVINSSETLDSELPSFVGVEFLLNHRLYGEVRRKVYAVLSRADSELNTLDINGGGGTSAGGSGSSVTANTSDDGAGDNSQSNIPAPSDPLGGESIW